MVATAAVVVVAAVAAVTFLEDEDAFLATCGLLAPDPILCHLCVELGKKGKTGLSVSVSERALYDVTPSLPKKKRELNKITESILNKFASQLISIIVECPERTSKINKEIEKEERNKDANKI